jgi:enoyl-CoA hydratase/carnithine racemase
MSNASYTHLTVELRDEVARVSFNRPDKRNAISDVLLEDLARFFSAPPAGARVVILTGVGQHFSAGLDLSEHKSRDAFEVMQHSQRWHEVTRMIQFGGLPVISVLRGAVLGGGLEIASATHVRIADSTTFYGLPEGQRGIFVGGGATVRVGRILGADRMTEMMLTGRLYEAEEGLRLGLSHYLVEPEAASAKAETLAKQIASNAPLSNYAMIHALPRIQDMDSSDGYFTESLMVGLVQTSEEAQRRIEAFLSRRRGGGK